MKKKNLDIMTLKSNLQKVSPNHSLMTNKHEPCTFCIFKDLEKFIVSMKRK